MGFKQPDMQARIKKLEAEPLGSTPERMREMIKESEDTWGPVVKAANIQVD
jgi:tripartite-type tricarboxylate transporter receptor subunit TctC